MLHCCSLREALGCPWDCEPLACRPAGPPCRLPPSLPSAPRRTHTRTYLGDCCPQRRRALLHVLLERHAAWRRRLAGAAEAQQRIVPDGGAEHAGDALQHLAGTQGGEGGDGLRKAPPGAASCTDPTPAGPGACSPPEALAVPDAARATEQPPLNVHARMFNRLCAPCGPACPASSCPGGPDRAQHPPPAPAQPCQSPPASAAGDEGRPGGREGKESVSAGEAAQPAR